MSEPTDRGWWQKCDFPAFEIRVHGWSLDKLLDLRRALDNDLTTIITQLETKGKTDLEWWKKARAARGFTQQKRALIKHMIGAENAKKSARTKERREKHDEYMNKRALLLQQARKQADQSNLRGALLSIIDIMELNN